MTVVRNGIVQKMAARRRLTLLIPAQRAITNRQNASGLSVSVRPQTSLYEQSELMGDDKFVGSLRVSRAGLDASRRGAGFPSIAAEVHGTGGDGKDGFNTPMPLDSVPFSPPESRLTVSGKTLWTTIQLWREDAVYET